MTRVQVLLTEDQDRKLETLARALGTSKTRLVRDGIDLVLRKKIARGADPLLQLVGQAGRVGRSDIAADHDRYLASARRRRTRT